VDGNPGSEKAAVGEALAHDGVEGMMEKIDGRGSDPCPDPCRSQLARLCRLFSYQLNFLRTLATISTYPLLLASLL